MKIIFLCFCIIKLKNLNKWKIFKLLNNSMLLTGDYKRIKYIG